MPALVKRPCCLAKYNVALSMPGTTATVTVWPLAPDGEPPSGLHPVTAMTRHNPASIAVRRSLMDLLAWGPSDASIQLMRGTAADTDSFLNTDDAAESTLTLSGSRRVPPPRFIR